MGNKRDMQCTSTESVGGGTEGRVPDEKTLVRLTGSEAAYRGPDPPEVSRSQRTCWRAETDLLCTFFRSGVSEGVGVAQERSSVRWTMGRVRGGLFNGWWEWLLSAKWRRCRCGVCSCFVSDLLTRRYLGSDVGDVLSKRVSLIFMLVKLNRKVKIWIIHT
ncbi:hypothetical protein M011DRAFT_19032 [Sporormia fimetaria CBS 119925]|uniref:Uncharacterized protein n=1 Tax=Sporormia fimetaria CBS 119925 TaxID=1340428 RepID=A0A6A6VQ41_9PLEO|nr:hypothetical protein M011DRAFT_19032 [Sporormia fimetaria CBS 119925]